MSPTALANWMAARAAGAKRFEGDPCRSRVPPKMGRCGRTTRYVAGFRGCVACTLRHKNEYEDRLDAAAGKPKRRRKGPRGRAAAAPAASPPPPPPVRGIDPNDEAAVRAAIDARVASGRVTRCPTVAASPLSAPIPPSPDVARLYAKRNAERDAVNSERAKKGARNRRRNSLRMGNAIALRRPALELGA